MPKRSYTDAEFEQAVKNNKSWAGVFRTLNLKVGGGQYVAFKKLAEKLKVDLSHMTGQGWNSGDNYRNPNKQHLSDILVENSTYSNTFNLKHRLWNESVLEKQCQECGCTDWFGRYNHLQIDHINGNRTDNRIENLRILCANCHSLTKTYCGKNKGGYDGTS